MAKKRSKKTTPTKPDPDFFDVDTVISVSTSDDCRSVFVGIRAKDLGNPEDFLATATLSNTEAATLGQVLIQRSTKNRQGQKSAEAKRRQLGVL